MGSKLNIEGIMLFEQPFTRVRLPKLGVLSMELNDVPQVPYENYRKVFRTSQKNIERELGGVQSASNELLSSASTGILSPEDAIKSIDTMIGKVENLKRKVSGMVFMNLYESPTHHAALRFARNGGKAHAGRHA